MKGRNYKIAKLIALFFSGKITGEERSELMAWVKETEENQYFFDSLHAENKCEAKFKIYRSDWQGAFQRFERTRVKKKRRSSRFMLRYAAILVVLLVSVLLFRWLAEVENAGIEIAGTNKENKVPVVMLTLGNGKQLELGGKDSILFSEQKNVVVNNRKNQLEYQGNECQSIEYNVLTTPRGKEYKIKLSDGTFVHLNAATALKYPVVFDSIKREVFLSGEAWFEIKKDRNRPFYVVTDYARVRVHGTKFNVNTIEDEGVQTVLVEGSVGIRANGMARETLLKPSQLAVISKTGDSVRVEEVDTTMYTGWREGVLFFTRERLGTILKKLSLWYDVDIVYADDTSRDIRFSGYLKKRDGIEVLLNVIQESLQVSCVLKDKTIVVSK